MKLFRWAFNIMPSQFRGPVCPFWIEWNGYIRQVTFTRIYDNASNGNVRLDHGDIIRYRYMQWARVLPPEEVEALKEAGRIK